MASSGTTSVQIDRDRLVAPGNEGCLHIVEIRTDDTRPEEQRLVDRTQRIFNVRAVLSKAQSQLDGIRGGITPGEGGCFITAPHDIHIEDPQGSYLISRNERGELAMVVRTVMATWYEEAFDIFFSGLTPFLDHLSFISNTPIAVDITEARDEDNHITTVTFRTPYETKVVSEGLMSLSSPLFPAYGLYREALCAHSNFYRFLCFFKIMEGIFKSIRPQLFRLAREQGISIAKEKDLVPEDPELQKFQPKYIGLPIHELFNGEFQSEYRHCVAHFALDGGGVMNPSSQRERSRFAGIVYLAQLCARELIRNQEGYFAQFFLAGGILDGVRAGTPALPES
jgi:hypothetical protein